ncbi:hypothetical protein M0R45_004066 [Rubus argutus]|uniref:Aldehyde dehydrogenase domain-containing protein n=1 Tax=Rubus argutus TaxID=59490 RepID=A0AAW1YIH6_RUBAR
MTKIVEQTLSELRQTFKSGRTCADEANLIKDHEEKVFEALYQDLGKHPVEAYRDEIGVVVKSVNYTLSNLDKWVASKKVELPLLLITSRGDLLPEPLGVVLIFASWNFPISLALDPVIGAIAAGNALVLKPSEQAPACSSFFANTIPQYLDRNAIRIIEGGAEISEQLLQQKWDKIFFTGSPNIGRIVMTAAASI